MRLHKVMAEHRRLAILEYLAECGEYTSNLPIVTEVVNAVGVSSTPDLVEVAAEWLQKKGLIELKPDGMRVTLTNQGLQVAKGRQFVNGVQRPDIE